MQMQTLLQGLQKQITMALNKETFKTRSLTALIFVAVMFAGLFINGILFIGLFCIIMLGCLYEFVKLAKIIHASNYWKWLPVALVYIVLPVLLMIRMGFTAVTKTVDGQTFAVPSFIYSALFPCAIIFSMWVNDTMAYITGSFIGKTPFSKISPKKTWEGTIGGAILCVVVIGLLGYFIPLARQVPVIHWVAIAAICAVFGTLGDLLESKLKRTANVKDSGNIMPGHGGFLDRFDSLLVATPVVALYLLIFL